jgi:hypothetical protein
MKNLKLSLTILFKLDTHFLNPNPEWALQGFFFFGVEISKNLVTFLEELAKLLKFTVKKHNFPNYFCLSKKKSVLEACN